MMAFVYHGLLFLAVAAASIYAAGPGSGGDPFPNIAASRIWKAAMELHRNDWCFACVDLCNNPKSPVVGEPVMLDRVRNSVSNFPADRTPDDCPKLCTGSLRLWLSRSILEILIPLVQRLHVEDPRRRELPDLAQTSRYNELLYSCTGDDVGMSKTIADSRKPPPQPGQEPEQGPDSNLKFQLQQVKKSQAYLASTAERLPSRIPVRGRAQGLGSLRMSFGDGVRSLKQVFGRMPTSAGSALGEAWKSYGMGGARNRPMPSRPMKPI